MLIAEHSMCQPGRPGPIGRLPRRLAGLGSLPQREVADVVLAVLVGLDPLPDPQALGIEAGQPPVRRPRRDPEEDRAVVGPVGVAPLEERRDQRDDLVDVVGRPRQDVRRRHPERLGVGQERARGSAPRASSIDSPAAAAPADDLVVDVGDVHDPGHLQAAPAQVADEQVGEQERAEVADVGRPVDRRAARVDADAVVAQAARAGGSRPTACRAGGPSRRHRSSVATASAEIAAAGALGAVEVAGRRLDVDRVPVEAEELGDRVAHRVEVGRPAAAGRRRSSRRRRPAASRRPRPAPTTSASSSVLAMPRGVRPSAGKSRPRSPRPAAPSSASATAWRATSPSEWPWRRGAPAISMPPSASGPPGPERMAVVTDPDARPRRAPASASTRRGAGRRAASP